MTTTWWTVNGIETEIHEPCGSNDLGHEYAEVECPVCGHEFCWSCASANGHNDGRGWARCPTGCGGEYEY